MKTIRWSRRRDQAFIDLRQPGSYRAEQQVCVRCGGPGRLVWADLVTKRARHECPRCHHGWVDTGADTDEGTIE